MSPAHPPVEPSLGQAPVARLWTGRSGCRLIQGPDDLGAIAHAAMGPALLRDAARTGTDILRCYRPPRTAAFTGLDRLAAGHDRAWEVATRHGFEPVRRGPGGRMAAYHQSSLCIDVVLSDRQSTPAPDPWGGMADLAAVLVESLRRCGVNAQAGQVEGEYCPGRFSINVDGRVKLAGTAARRMPGALLLSAVVVIGDVEPVRAVTTDVYAALQFPFVPATVGCAAQYVPGLTAEAFQQDLLALIGSRVELAEDFTARTVPSSPPS